MGLPTIVEKKPVAKTAGRRLVALVFGIIIFTSSLTTLELLTFNSQNLDSYMAGQSRSFSFSPTSNMLWTPTESNESKAEQFSDPTETKNAGATPAVEREPDETTIAKGNHTEAITFKRYEKVAIVTKIHGPHQWLLLEQSICLLHFAYNNRVHYDIVVFSALEVPNEKIEELRNIVAPAKFDIVIDNIGFQEEIAALTPAKHELFLKRCNVSTPVNLTWWSSCEDPGSKGTSRLAYNWQAEFRSVRVWDHPALDNYRYMFWLDSDGFPSRPIEKDPIEYFIENKAVIMFEHFPQGSDRGRHTQAIVDSFNATVCDLSLGKKGHLERNLITREQYRMRENGNKTVKCDSVQVPMIHGFGHITDLDFYRQPKVLNGLKGLLGDCFLCRSPDDQLAVTIAPAIYAPEKSFDMRMHGFNLGIAHNGAIDGQNRKEMKPKNFVKYWDAKAKNNFPSEVDKVCRIKAGS
mmetsp:Transcript_22054/g.54551  ORF Transcript_22054/g.54551 Transcript_22054/m.54551 type:complete len:464 (-) Transcript_22054:599-1990(-)